MSDPVDQIHTLSGAEAVPAAPAAPRPRILGDRYRLEERIASGGMASVWRARDEVLARTVAVKVLHDHLAADAGFRERFRREAIAAAKLTHPNVVGLYDTGCDRQRVFLVMEFVDGVTLRDVISDLSLLEPDRAAAVGEKVARALAYAHERGLVHRDIKPANILVASDGTVKVADFGIAKAEEADADLTRTGTVLGTAAYLAPEQVLTQPVDGRADQYALGCCLYEALTGRQPFTGDSAVATAAQRLERDPLPPRSIRPDLPPGLDAIVVRAMARQPDDRFSSAAVLADALMGFADAADTAVLTASTATVSLPLPHGAAAQPVGTRVTEPAWPEPAAARADESFLRSEGRWLGPVLALLALAGALVGVPLAAGILEVADIPVLGARVGAEQLAGPRADAPVPVPVPVPVVAISAFDPQGDRRENDEDLPALTDANPTTTWRSDLYHSADFGGLKDGLGFWVDLGAPHRLESVTLQTTTPGVAYELRVADQPAPTVEGWRVVAGVPAAARSQELGFDAPVPTRYLLVWVTANLRPEGGRYKVELSDLIIRGTPA